MSTLVLRHHVENNQTDIINAIEQLTHATTVITTHNFPFICNCILAHICYISRILHWRGLMVGWKIDVTFQHKNRLYQGQGLG